MRNSAYPHLQFPLRHKPALCDLLTLVLGPSPSVVLLLWKFPLHVGATDPLAGWPKAKMNGGILIGVEGLDWQADGGWPMLVSSTETFT